MLRYNGLCLRSMPQYVLLFYSTTGFKFYGVARSYSSTCSYALLTLYIVMAILQFVSSDECIVSAARDKQVLSPGSSVFLQSFLVFGAYYCTALYLLGRNLGAFYPPGLEGCRLATPYLFPMRSDFLW